MSNVSYSYLTHWIDGVYLKVSFDVAGYGVNDILFSGENVENAGEALGFIPGYLVSKEIVRRLVMSDVYSLPIQKMSEVKDFSELDELLKYYGV
ncbi:MULTISPECIES: hypothetical protein [unclassified Halomonas]|uniref:hypothetical protein n=1 Tax=unclassified Halomonas TaxID=2609666 RepID=UPI00111A9AFD|nr:MULTISPECIES: hypothetical protein [unclassified Halomonas]